MAGGNGDAVGRPGAAVVVVQGGGGGGGGGRGGGAAAAGVGDGVERGMCTGAHWM